MHTADARVDVAIIGAGPAGSAAAIQLARAGRSVLLVDRQTFPRDKVCGGCLSGAATSRLVELLGHNNLPGILGGTITFMVGPLRLQASSRSATRIVSRVDLDACLVRAAASAGTVLRLGEPAGLQRATHGWEVTVGDDRFAPRTILVASGLAGIPAALGIPHRRSGPAMFGMAWTQPAAAYLPLPGCVELHWLHGGYIGFATLNASRCMVALAAKTSEVAGRNCMNALYDLNPQSPVWQMVVDWNSRRLEAKGTAGFPWLPARLGIDNVLLIGDAAGFIEPFTGEGMGQALFSAQCACHAILRGGDLLRCYTAAMRRHRRILWRTQALSVILQAPSRLGRVAKLAPHRLLAKVVERVHVGSYP